MTAARDPLLRASLEILEDRAARHRARRARALAAGSHSASAHVEHQDEPDVEAWVDAFASLLKLEVAAGELRSVDDLRARFGELREHELARHDSPERATVLFAVTWERVAARMIATTKAEAHGDA